MILQALAQHYDCLVQKGVLEQPGWQKVRVHFALRLSEDGALLGIVDLRSTEIRGKKTVLVPQLLNVPEQVKRSSGIEANFLCENSGYFLGCDQKGKPEHTMKCFDACSKLHHELLNGVEHPAAKAILRFFETWEPAKAAENEFIAPIIKDLSTGNIVFMLGGTYAQEVSEIANVWQAHYDKKEADAVQMRCLVTGEIAPIARLHPTIKGVQGAQSSGASLVSFNSRAFESFGRDEGQGLNAPVSRRAAFAYGAALNELLSNKDCTAHFGDTTVVFWAQSGEDAPVDMLRSMIGVADDISSDLSNAMRKLEQGDNLPWEEWNVDPDVRFFILGIAPNAARLSVRFFLQDRFGAIAESVAAHHRRMEIVRPSFDKREFLPIWLMLNETVNPKSRSKDSSPHMTGDLLQTILHGGRYPTTLYEQVQLRIRAERDISRGKAAIIKAYLIQNESTREYDKKGVLKVSLNEEANFVPYVLGRLFSVLEGLQGSANPGINTTIRDKYFTSACATPAIVFPTLLNLAQAHLKKVDEGIKIYYDKQITELMGKLGEMYPKQLDIYDQGVFQLGYYHQTQKRFEKKEEK